MEKPKYVHAVSIETTLEKLWDALINGDLTHRYWFGRRVESDWKVGSPITFTTDDGELSDSGEILVYDPPRRLSYTFRCEFIPEMRAEGFTKVSCDLEPQGSQVKLTVTHEDFISAESQVYEAIKKGWPAIIANLKSLLETGEVIDSN